MISLDTLETGETVKVVGFDKSNAEFRRKLLSLGLTPGAELEVVRKAPLGDPIQIKVRGFSLALRRAEASGILVEQVA